MIKSTDSKPTHCPRCNEPFDSKITKIKKFSFWAKFCENCQYKNLIDGLGLPTPPELLDIYTIWPTLTREEYKKALNNTHKEYEEDEKKEIDIIKG